MTTIQFSNKCKTDNECESGVCEMTYDTNGNPKGRLCLDVNQKYGEKCIIDNDCPSGQCLEIFDDNGFLVEKRCKATKYKYDPSKYAFSEQSQEFRHGIVNNAYRQQLIEQHKLGRVGKFIIEVMEALIKVVTNIFDMLVNIFFSIFKFVFKTFLGGEKSDGPFGGVFFGLIHSKSKKSGKCLSMYWMRTIITILLPPFGVFLARGFVGIPYIILCSILTMFFYFPGLIYAFAVINNSECEVMDNLGKLAK